MTTDRTPAEAVQRMIATLGDDPFHRIEELREAGRRKAEAEGVAYRMERERKSLLARLASEYANAHAKSGMSEAKLDRLARADPRYQKHIEGTAAAIEEREHAKSEYWGIQQLLTWLDKTVSHDNVTARLGEP